jgi:glycosyltransferase involved in cell wall biosynthesis
LWTCHGTTIAGDKTRDPVAAAQLENDIAKYGLEERINVLGAVSFERVMESSDVFVLASRFESYGMALAEAIAHGISVVSTTAGAIADTVADGTGLLVPPENVVVPTQAIRQLVGDQARRRRFAANARPAGAHLPLWKESAQLFARSIEAVAA